MNTTRITRSTFALGVALAALLPPALSANPELWIGNPGVGASTNWSDLLNWTNLTGVGLSGPAGNDVIFGDTGGVGTANTINSVVDSSGLNPVSLTFTNQSYTPSFLYHTILLPDGVSLTNGGAFTVGASSTINGYKTVVNFVGGGSLVQTGANLTVKSINSAASSGATATLDLSGLTNFVYTAAAGTMVVGGSGGDARGGGTLTLSSGSNRITVGTINIVTGTGNGGAGGGVNLGSGTNIINVNTLNLCAGKVNTATLKFLDVTGGLRIRGAGGTDTDRANFTLVNRNTGGTGGMTGTADFTGGHPVDIKAGNIILAEGVSNPSSANQAGTANFRFDQGTVDAITLNLASNTVANANSTANLVVAGGSLTVSNVSLVHQTAGNANGNLFLGGTMTCSGNLFKNTAAGVANITITNGTLAMAAGRSVGTPDKPVDNLNLGTATLQLSVVNDFTNINVAALNFADDGSTINVAALPSIGSFPIQFPVISFTSLPGAGSIHLGTLPGGYSGYVSNDLANTVWLVVTNGLFVAKSNLWVGTANNLWDTTTLNWKSAASTVAYRDGDFVTFDDTAATNNVSLTAALQPTSLLVSNNTLNYTFSGAGSISGPVGLTKLGAAALTLTETGGDNFSLGITVGGGSLILDNPGSAILGGLNVAAGATAQIGNDDANGALPAGAVSVDGALVFKRSNDLSVGTAISGAGGVTKGGAGKLTLTSSNLYAGATRVNNGSLVLTGAGSISSSSEVDVSGAALDLSSFTTPTTLPALNLTNATLSLAMPGVTTPLSVASLGLGGAGNTLNLGSLPPIASYPVTLTLINSAATVSGFNLALGTLPAGTPAYGGTLTVNGTMTAVVLTLTNGPVGIRPAVFWSGADAAVPDRNWTDATNWLLPGAPAPTENAIFNNAGTGTASLVSTAGGGLAALAPENINNIVDTDFTLPSLTYTNLGGTYHNTFIARGKSLTITNTLTVGAIDGGAPANQEYVAIAGTNAVLTVSNPAANLQVWLGNGSVGDYATLDLSALDTFNATISRLTIGSSAINNAVNRPGGTLYLARTNIITAGFQTTTIESAGTTTGNAAIGVADCNQNAGSASYLYLGRVNTISADTIAIGRQKASGHFLFNPIYANSAPYPTLTLQGATTGRVGVFNLADGVGNTGTTTISADSDWSGGIVSASVDLMNIGRSSSGGTSGNATGTLTFDAGTINVNTLNLGLQPAANTKAGIGNLNVNSNATIGLNAVLIVNGNLNLATAPAGSPLAATAGTLNITAALVQASNIVAGVGTTSTINLTDGTLIVSNTAGAPTAPLSALNLSGGTLQLNVDGNATAPALVAASIAGNGITVLRIGTIVNVTGTVTLALIGYSGNDPYANLSLGSYPGGYSASLVDNTANSTIDITLTRTALPEPHIVGVSFGGGNLTLSGTNGTINGPFRVLTTTDLSLPRSSWTLGPSGNFDGTGGFNVVIPIAVGEPQRFYVLQAP